MISLKVPHPDVNQTEVGTFFSYILEIHAVM